jgi:DNA helicase II / ATP-dependent DNA helicase PcrA
VEYEFTLNKEKALDFDDLLLKTLKLLQNEEILAKYQNRWKYIHIDEYQDTNKVQYDIAKLLAGKHQNIAVVGDIDQSVYSWRGADFKNIMRFEKDYENATTMLLEQNYRSTKTIIAVANTVIAKNVMRKDKNLFTENEEGDQISLYIAGDEKDEPNFIARTAKMLVSQGVSPSEIAVLYRANFQSRVIEEACIKKELAYELIGTKFFERKEVKEVLSYIKGALNPESLSDLKRIINVPARGIGKVTMLKIFEGGESELTGAVKIKIEKWRELLREIKVKCETFIPSEVVKYVIKHSGLEMMYQDDKIEGAERLGNIRELVTIATGYDAYDIGEGMEKFLEHTALSSDQDEVDKKVGIKLMTIHASKGLEFDYIFIGGLEQGQFPSERVGKTSREDQEEERRLFYVALTRARKKIYLAYTQMRTIYGSRQINVPSEFISDIGEEFLQYENGSPSDQVDWSKGLLQLDF